MRFFQHAREAGISLKEQCRILGIPWEFRNLHVEEVCGKVLDDWDHLDSRTLNALADVVLYHRSGSPAMSGDQLYRLMGRLRHLSPRSRLWVLRHMTPLGGSMVDVCAYLRDNPISTMSVKPQTIIKRMRDARNQEVRGRDGFFCGQVYFRENEMTEVVMPAGVESQEYQVLGDGSIVLMSQFTHPHEVIVTSPIPEHAFAPYSPNNRLSIRLLRDREEFVQEGAEMNHCVSGYYGKVARGECLIASVTNQAGAKVATAEISRSFEVGQVRGHSNEPVCDSEVLDLISSFASHLSDTWDAPAEHDDRPETAGKTSAGVSADPINHVRSLYRAHKNRLRWGRGKNR